MMALGISSKQGALMSYLALSESKSVTLAIGDISGALSSGAYLTMTLEHDEISIAGSGTSTLTLPSGHYAVSGIVGADMNNTSSDLFDFSWELDSSLIGAQGGRQPNGKVGSDAAEAVFSVETTSSLRLKVTAITGSPTILSTHSQVFIRRVSL
jgi:hypothetical protein